jgi:hypothetical protein
LEKRNAPLVDVATTLLGPFAALARRTTRQFYGVGGLGGFGVLGFPVKALRSNAAANLALPFRLGFSKRVVDLGRELLLPP